MYSFVVESERRQMEAWHTAWWEMDWLSWQMKSTWRSAPPCNLLTAFPPPWPLTIWPPTSRSSTLKPPAPPQMWHLSLQTLALTSPRPPSHPSASRRTRQPLAPWLTRHSRSQRNHPKPSTTPSSMAFLPAIPKPFPKMAGLWCLRPSLHRSPPSRPRSSPLCLLVPSRYRPRCCLLPPRATRF